MLSGRDKLLAGLFAVQLGAAAAFGAVLVHGLHHETTTVLSQESAVGAAPAPGAVAQPAAAAPGPVSAGAASAAPAAGTGPTTVTSVVGGSAGSAGTAAGPTAAPAASGAAPTKGSSKSTGGTAGSPSKGPSGAAAGGGAASEIAPGAPITIGSIVTQSGAINFGASAQATKAYIDMVNQAGGVDGHQIKLIQDDDQLSGPTGDSEFKSLASQGVFAFAAFNAPETEGGLKTLLDGEGIPLIGSYGEYDEYHDQLAFAFTAAYVHYGYEMGAYLKSLGAKTPALLYVNNNDANANAEIENGFAAGFGAAPAYTAQKSPTDTYQSDVTQMKVKGVDGLASVLDAGSYQRFLQAAGSYAQQIKHVAAPTFNVDSVKSLSNADGTYVASDFSFVDSTDPKVTAYVNAVKAEGGGGATIDYFGEVGWFDGELLVDALKNMHGVYTKAGLVKAVESLGTYSTGLTSPLAFSPGNRDINRCIQFGKVSQGKVVPTQGYTCDTQQA